MRHLSVLSEAANKKSSKMASKLDRLAAMAREGAKSTVAEATGTNGQPKVILEHGSGALAEIYAHGATVTRYRSPGGREVLWTSSIAVFDGKKAIRGGIPVVFPFFGPNPDERVGTIAPCPQHGFARTSRWSIAINTPLRHFSRKAGARPCFNSKIRRRAQHLALRVQTELRGSCSGVEIKYSGAPRHRRDVVP